MPSIVASHAAGPETAERADEEIDLSVAYSLDVPWRAIVWNDPVNLMTYVVYVFQTYFGFTREKATRLMMQVHHDGKAVVATGTREAMEAHVHAMHGYGLTATLDRLES